MSLGLALKGTAGIVLAADSRVTLFNTIETGQDQRLVVPATFDNATKLLKAEKQRFVAAVTFGAGSIGSAEPRTASSFMPEFEAEIANEERLTVPVFSDHLSKFFLDRWHAAKMPPNPGPGGDMTFLVSGYDPGAAYGTVYGFAVPTDPSPRQLIPDGMFGVQWGGQTAWTNRLLSGFDPELPSIVQELLGIPAHEHDAALAEKLKARLGVPIPWQFLPLQDCVDLAIFVIRTTIALQQWTVGIRGVGGAVDVATITQTEGLREVQIKQITGEKI